MTFPDVGEVEAAEPMSADVRLVSPATTPGCLDEEKCLTEPLTNGQGLHGYRQKWGATPRWHLLPVWTATLSALQVSSEFWAGHKTG